MTQAPPRPNLSIRLAVADDMPALTAMMNRAIGELLKPFLTQDQVRGSYEIMGLDSQLIADGTYFVVEDEAGTIGGCGGWSRRATLFGGDHSAGRDAALAELAALPIDANVVPALGPPPLPLCGRGRD